MFWLSITLVHTLMKNISHLQQVPWCRISFS